MNYVFLIILSAVTTKLIMEIIIKFLSQQDNTGEQTTAVIPFLVMCVVGVLVMTQLPQIASSLGGGVSLSTGGLVNKALKATAGATFAAIKWGLQSNQPKKPPRTPEQIQAARAARVEAMYRAGRAVGTAGRASTRAAIATGQAAARAGRAVVNKIRSNNIKRG